jgi:hypothetical protein
VQDNPDVASKWKEESHSHYGISLEYTDDRGGLIGTPDDIVEFINDRGGLAVPLCR